LELTDEMNSYVNGRRIANTGCEKMIAEAAMPTTAAMRRSKKIIRDDVFSP